MKKYILITFIITMGIISLLKSQTIDSEKIEESVFLFQENTPFKSLSKIPTDKLSVFDFGNYKLEDL